MDAYLGSGRGFVDKRVTQGDDGGNVGTIDTSVNYNNAENIRARLLAIGGYFTAARVDNMTLNDAVYALRLNDDAAGI